MINDTPVTFCSLPKLSTLTDRHIYLPLTGVTTTRILLTSVY